MEWTWKIKLSLKLEIELMGQLKERADDAAIEVSEGNLHNLLMTAPASNKVVLGLDPGYRTGVKVVVVDGTGKLLTHTRIFPHPSQKQWQQALNSLAQLYAA